MASIWQRRGLWYLGFRPPGASRQKTRALGRISKAEAEEIKHAVESKTARESASRLVPGFVTLADVLEQFLAEKSERREARTARTYRTHVAHFRRILATDIRLADVRPEAIARYLTTRRKEGASPQTCNKERTTLGTIFRWAIRRRLATWNPVEGTEPFSFRATPPEACSPELHAEVVAALRKATKDKDERADSRRAWGLLADMQELLWATGWRIGEACALTVDRVDEHAKTVRLVSAWNKGPAAVPVPQSVWTIIARWTNAARDAGSPFVFFVERIAGRPFRDAYTAIDSAWERWCRAHPSHRGANWHRLRHAYASALEAAGVDLRTSMALTRHQTLRVLGHYSHRGLDELREAQAAVERSRKAKAKQRRGSRRPSRRSRRDAP